MALDYLIKDSVFVSNDKWAKYLEASFIDSDNVERPLQLQFELVPGGLTTKVCISVIIICMLLESLRITLLNFCTDKCA